MLGPRVSNVRPASTMNAADAKRKCGLVLGFTGDVGRSPLPEFVAGFTHTFAAAAMLAAFLMWSESDVCQP